MNLYNENMCLWCWECDLEYKIATWTIISIYNGETQQERVCDACKDLFSSEDYLQQRNCEPDEKYEIISVTPYNPYEIKVFQRGDRVEIVRINRPKLTGTVVHCYMSMRDFQSKVNIVIDGKKWPAVYPAHIVQKRVAPERKVA